jgi:proteasome accessory factor B
VSRKSERLVNLTIALLATKRYLTKAEIFANVAGYEGDQEAKDRMFERDKDDLRSLGIVIELGTFDPLFEDEAGYRIKPETYALQIDDLDTTSIAILSHASQMWRSAALGESAQTGLRKLKGLGLDSDITEISGVAPALHVAPEQLPDLVEAITDRREISFEYRNEEMQSELRAVQPYRISNSRGYWYLIGHDTGRDGLRTFRLDRFDSAVSFTSNAGKFTVNLDVLDNEESEIEEVPTARISLRKERQNYFSHSTFIRDIDDDWCEIEVQFHDQNRFFQELLWLETDARLLSPDAIVSKFVSVLEMAVANHG